ncbi:GIY-YIG nuclease family protein [Streptomyces puniciscabiei]|uniref:GIY-YIG nuclease family protein n=1 Tax=Streptomyces puniciscabiei TaxID=164348 RepID=UPI00131CFF43|nr:GIY-YIG nuclease family protein [Streptomyces puniciscabiei]
MAETLLGVLTCVLIALISVLESALVIPRIGRYGTSSFDKWCLNAQYIALIFMWFSLLGHEYVHRHERAWAKKSRRYGYTIQGLALALCAATNWGKGIWGAVIVAFLLLMVYSVWDAYMKALALHPEDQKVLDQIIEQKRQRAQERWEEEQRHRRAARLEEAAAQYGQDLAIDPSETKKPSVEWKIPSRKHQPLVYFIRNGNRVKIGTTTDLRRRVRTLALRPENVVLLEAGGMDRERDFHKRFEKYREGNTEWFRDLGELSAYITERVEEIRRQQAATRSGSADR